MSSFLQARAWHGLWGGEKEQAKIKRLILVVLVRLEDADEK